MSEFDREYDVVVVRRGFDLPASWRHEPPAGQASVVGVMLSGVERWVAAAWVRAFNRREQRQPYGVWATTRFTETIHPNEAARISTTAAPTETARPAGTTAAAFHSDHGRLGLSERPEATAKHAADGSAGGIVDE